MKQTSRYTEVNHSSKILIVFYFLRPSQKLRKRDHPRNQSTDLCAMNPG